MFNSTINKDRAVNRQSLEIIFVNTSFLTVRPRQGSPCHGEGSNEGGTVALGTTEGSSNNMNEVMQIESSTCNVTNVAPHISQATAISVSENASVGASITITGGGTTIIPAPNSGSTISVSAPPMVFTVNAQQTSAGAPVLKLVSPVEGGAPQLIKVVPASAFVNPTAPISQSGEAESQVATSSATTTIYQNTGTVAVVQKMNDGPSGQSQSSDGSVVSQRVYSIVPANQQKTQSVVTSAVIQKTQFNNGQQRIHALPAQLTNARVAATVAAVGTAGTQKVQILSNVVVSKQNIVLNKTPLQAQRQILTTIAQKPNSNVPKTVVTAGKPPVTIPQTQPQQISGLAPPKIQIVNNLSIKPLVNNSFAPKALKTVTAMNRPALQVQQPVIQQPKTIKTLSPGSQKPPGIKTLSPSMANHFNNKIPPAGGPARVGIKTLGPQKPPMNNRAGNSGPKPNYIGKHANQAQKMQHKNVPSGMPGAKPHRNTAAQRVNYALLSPTKNANSQSNYNQALTAQILQSLPSAGPTSTTKMYPLQSPPDEASLSENVAGENQPDFVHSLAYLYQIVMLDHNYGAPPPASPPPVMPRSSVQHQSPGGGGTLNGALLAAVGREREKEREREVLQMNASAGLYGSGGTNTGKRHNRHANNAAISLPPANPAPVLTNIVPTLPLSANLSSAVQDDDAASTISSEGGRADEGDEGEETETAPEGEGDEDGITKCICDFVHDDGYMICCDVCSSWQHIVCMGIDKDQIPEKYSCVRCLPRRVDRQQARSIQLKRLKELPPLGVPPPAPPVPAPEIRPVSGSTSDTGSDTSTAESTGEPHHPPHYGRQQPTGKLSLNNNLIRKKRNTPVPVSARRKSEPAPRRNPLQKRQQRRESARETSTTGRRTTMKKRETNKVLKRKMKSRSSVDDDSQDSWHGAASAYSNSMGASVVQLRQWIENYEEAVTNHYSPELRARITNMRVNGSHTAGGTANQPLGAEKQAPPTAQADVAVQKCRVGNQPLSGFKIVLATQTLSTNAPVIELRGKYMLSTQHRTASGAGSGGGAGGGGLQTRQHSQRPGPFLFFYRLPRDGTEVCVDTRTYGNDARFIRRSCRPNAELRHLVEKGTLHLYVITTTNLDKNNELTIKHESHDLAAVAAAASSGNNLSQATAAVAAACVPCACGGGPQTCGLYNSTRKNGGVSVSEASHTATNNIESTTHRKRRGRRASTPNRSETPPPPPPPPPPPAPEKEKEVEKEASPSPVPPQIVIPPVVEPPVEEEAPPTPAPPALSTRRASSHQRAAQAAAGVPIVPVSEIRTRSTSEHSVERDRESREAKEPLEAKESREERKTETKDKKKKLTREERKMEAIMKAFERMEKAQQKKQEVQARQAQRKESDPIPPPTEIPQEQKRPTISLRQENGEIEQEIVRTKRKKRKGRSRTISTNSQQSTTRRSTRVNSTDSYITSGDDSSLLSPPLPVSSAADTIPSPRHTRSMSSQERHSATDNSGAEHLPRDLQSPEPTITVVEKFQNTPGSQLSDISSPGQVVSAAGMLLSLANGGVPGGSILASEKSPDVDGNSSGSNSSLQSSPTTPLSSACLLVAAAVGPLEPGFKFPKTKKAIMNEWLNKPSDSMPIPSAISPSLSLHTPVIEPLSSEQTATQQPLQSLEYYSPGSTTSKSLATLVQAATLCDSPPQAGGRNLAGGQGAGNAKKRWLRQAISEECDSPCSRPESPPGSSEMVAPPKKRRLARESLSSEQSFTPPTTPTMLVPPSNSLADEDYPNNDEEFYTNEDRNQNLSDSSPPTTDDSGKEPSRTENIYCSGEGSLGPGTGYQHRDELDAEMGLKDHVSDMQMDFGDIKDEEKKYPDALPSSLLDPRLGRDSRPIFRDSAQLLGTVEKTIRFYEENLTGPVTAPEPILSPPPAAASPVVPCGLNAVEEPVSDILEQPIATAAVLVTSKPIIPVSIAPEIELITPTVELPLSSPVVPEPIATPVIVTPVKTEKPAPKPEIITPAKRKLSISEYRQRKQLKPGSERNSAATSPERANSPETPPPASISNISSAVTTTSTSGSANSGLISPTSTIPAARSRTRSASSSSSTSSDEESIAGTAIIDVISDVKASSGVEPQLPMAFNSAPTAVERQRENVERLKKAFGLAIDDEARKNATITREPSAISPKTVTSPIIPAASPGKIASPKIVKASPPTINPALTTSDLLAKISEGSITTKLMLSLETSSLKRPKSPPDLSLLKRSSPERVILKNPPSPEPAKSRSVERELELTKSNNMQHEDLDSYTKFQENVTASFIPPFNNPVYPNSAQFTGFSSVIDSSAYEGRNPSPPPSELLKSSPYASNSSLTMSPSTTGYK